MSILEAPAGILRAEVTSSEMSYLLPDYKVVSVVRPVEPSFFPSAGGGVSSTYSTLIWWWKQDEKDPWVAVSLPKTWS